MCEKCGCDGGSEPAAMNLQSGRVLALEPMGKGADLHEHVHADGTRHYHRHATGHGHHADAAHTGSSGPVIPLEARILAKNDALAAHNRAWLLERDVFALNLMGAPGAGKTTLLERTIQDVKGRETLCVVEGDQATSNDGERIRAAGAAVVQVNTGTGCHLEASMVERALSDLEPAGGALVIIENVGNLVCPALFDLGESRRVVVFSVTEGQDKPLKYPHMFRTADLVLLNKIDLLPYVQFNISAAHEGIHAINPDCTILGVSAQTGEGMAAWYTWLREARQMRRAASV